MLLRVTGWLLITEACFLLAPLVTSVCYGEADWQAFGVAFLATALAGTLLALYSRPESSHMGKRDGYLLTALVWVVFSLFGLIPFILCSTPMTFGDAFFEAMSGFTTTGASVIADTANMGYGIHIWRAMMQWLGGMGIILFTLAVIPMLNHSGGIQMFNAEVTGITHDKIMPRISQTAKGLWLIYLLLTLALVLLLWAGPMDFFDSVCHAFGTISTGGYTTHPAGITAWHGSVYVKVVLVVFMFLGGVNFSLIFRCARGQGRTAVRNDAFRMYVLAIGVMLLLFVAAIAVGGNVGSWQSVTIDPLFQVVSTITSTGFCVSEFTGWGAFVLALTLVMMFCGACAGSTSGGAKIDRLIYLLKNNRNELYRCVYPNTIRSVKINGKIVSPDIVNKVIAFLCLYVMVVVAGGIVLTACGVAPVDAFFSAFSCMSNTGFSAAVTGYGGSYITMPYCAKWVLTVMMLIGRLEIFTILVLFTPAFWRR